MSALAEAPSPAAPPRARLRAPRGLALQSEAARRTSATLAFTALLLAITLKGGGGLQLGPLTAVQVGADLLAGVLGVLAVLSAGATRRPWGVLALASFGLLAVVTALSVTWALEPAEAWREANRTTAWLALFASGFALARLVPERWDALLHATVLTAVGVALVALGTKVLPGTFAPDETYARLRAPFGYWNAVGIATVLGVPGALWLGARRHGHAAISALSHPALGLLLVACLLSYSRGALLALAIGLVVLFALVPLRLRAAVVLISAGVAAGLVALWAFGQPGLVEDNAELAIRTSAGQELGVLLAAMLVALTIVGLLTGFLAARRAPSLATRRAAGVAIAVVLCLVPIGGVSALALSEKGLTRSVSDAWRTLTDPQAIQPTNRPDRLTAVGSVRARYFDEALRMFRDEPVRGLGAGGYATARPRYERVDDATTVRHAHGYVVQTLADLGLVGAGASLLLVLTWLGAAWRATGGRRPVQTPERIGLVVLGSVVVTFAAHSLLDWTWYVPGAIAPALLCAGWVAGRGPSTERPGARPARGPLRWGLATVIAVVALAAAWTAWQPHRAQAQADRALERLEAGDVADARAAARSATDIDPLSPDPWYALATVERVADRPDAARQALEEAVATAPADAETWLSLAQFELRPGGDERLARRAIGAALYLDPGSDVAAELELRLLRADQPAQP